MSLNWRQRHTSPRERIAALTESLVHTGPFAGTLVRVDGLAAVLAAEIDALAGLGLALSVTSRIWRSDGRLRGHLALMNLHPEGFVDAAEVVTAISTVVGGVPGYVLESGRYLHYYGARILAEDEWLDFLAQFLMPCTLVSPRYVGHCVVRRFCALRINSVPPYKPVTPRLVAALGMPELPPVAVGRGARWQSEHRPTG